jgi:hypothetical protein
MRPFLPCLAALTALSAGCSDPPLPIPAGAFSVQFTDTGASCNIASHTVAVGEVGASGDTTLISDGTDADVSCSVTPATGGFSVSAKISSRGSFLQVSIAKISNENDESNAAEGRAVFASSNTAGNNYAPTDVPCTFWFSSADQNVASGAIWASFACPSLTSKDSTCSIQQGFFQVTNCDGAVAEE